MRAFVAIEVPGDVRERLADSIERLRRSHRGWRWADPSRAHLTLAFLGEVDAGRIDEWTGALASAARELLPVRFSIVGAGAFPARGAPRVLWAGVADVRPASGLAVAAGKVREVAGRLDVAVDDRPFRPHLTLARALRGARPDRPRADALGRVGDVDARQAVLFRSDPGVGGVRHIALARFTLGEVGGGIGA